MFKTLTLAAVLALAPVGVQRAAAYCLFGGCDVTEAQAKAVFENMVKKRFDKPAQVVEFKTRMVGESKSGTTTYKWIVHVVKDSLKDTGSRAGKSFLSDPNIPAGQARVLDLVDVAHPTAAQEADDLVGVVERRARRQQRAVAPAASTAVRRGRLRCDPLRSERLPVE